MTLQRFGMLRAGASALYVFSGPANQYVNWTIVKNSGPGTGGTLTPISAYSDAAGVASAVWDGTGASSTDNITVTATVKV